MQRNEVLQSSYNMSDEEKYIEYVIDKMSQIYNFNPEDDEQLIEFRELIRNTILLYNKAKDLDDLNYGEQ